MRNHHEVNVLFAARLRNIIDSSGRDDFISSIFQDFLPNLGKLSISRDDQDSTFTALHFGAFRIAPSIIAQVPGRVKT
jgi:hypothetical protein